MNLHAVMLAPWRACRPAMRWAALVIAVLAVLGAIAMGIFLHESDWWIGSLALLSFGNGFLWAFVFSSMALLAVDARQLRIPGVQRNVIAAMLLYGLLCVTLPAGALALFAGHALTIATLLALGCLCGLLFGLLPRILSAFAGFLPMTLQALPARLHLPGPSTPDFIHWGIPTALAMLLIAALCWRRLLHADDPYKGGMSEPMVLQFRRGNFGNGWNIRSGFAGGGVDNTQQIRNRPDWMQPKADLRGCGPDHVVHSLRVALGGLFIPLTLTGRLRQLALLLIPSMLFVVLMTISSFHEHATHAWASAWHAGGMLMLIWFGGFGSAMLSILLLAPLQQRWQKTNAELPLLALLPGLHNAACMKRDLLRAILLLPLGAQTLLLLVLLALANGLHMSLASTVLLSLSQLGGIGFMLAFALSTIGGRPVSNWGAGLLAAFGYGLICISIFLPTLSNGVQLDLGGLWLTLLAAAWATLIVMLLWLGRRGWRGLQERPHPFLPN